MHPLLQLLAALVGILQIVIIVRIVITYFPNVSPYSPWVMMLRRVSDPLLGPVRRALPTLGGIDFSPLVVLLLLAEIQSILNTVGYGGSITAIIALLVFNLIQNILLFFAILLAIRVMVQLFQADRFHPLVLVIHQLTNPLVVPFNGITRNRDVVSIIALSAYMVLYLVVTLFGRSAVGSIS